MSYTFEDYFFVTYNQLSQNHHYALHCSIISLNILSALDMNIAKFKNFFKVNVSIGPFCIRILAAQRHV